MLDDIPNEFRSLATGNNSNNSNENTTSSSSNSNENEAHYDDLVFKKLIQSSGKLVLLDKLLPRLYEQGHKVLIFSQMVKVLNIIEEYLNYRGYSHERLDGSLRSSVRNAAVKRFCKPSMNRFIMLLSTKAGGLGLNLVAADTVIICGMLCLLLIMMNIFTCTECYVRVVCCVVLWYRFGLESS